MSKKPRRLEIIITQSYELEWDDPDSYVALQDFLLIIELVSCVQLAYAAHQRPT